MKIYAVGGSVRDKLRGLDSRDKDYVVVGSTEAEMLQLGYQKVGADFPVFINDAGEQYALARKERKIGPGYHGFIADFDSSVTLEDDLYRRDLTINAIAQDLETGEIVDPYNGQDDLAKKILRHVGPPFIEDPLRVIRLARFFACMPGFDIAVDTAELVATMSSSGELDHLTEERVWVELEKAIERSVNCFRFFYALEKFRALPRLKIINDALGDIELSKLVIAAKAILRLKDEERVSAFIALAASNPKQSSPVIPTQVKKLTSAIAKLRAAALTSECAYDLIHFNRGFDVQSPNLDAFIRTVIVAEAAGCSFPFEAQQLFACIDAARGVTSEKYQHLSGPEIGKAMAAARLEKIRIILGA